jgi:hypothetical protein
MPALIERGIADARSHFFYGGAPGVPEELAERLAARYPALRVAGTLSPPFRPLSPEEEADIVGSINAARPDYVWVGLGTPKQDLWIAANRPRLNASALLARRSTSLPAAVAALRDGCSAPEQSGSIGSPPSRAGSALATPSSTPGS